MEKADTAGIVRWVYVVSRRLEEERCQGPFVRRGINVLGDIFRRGGRVGICGVGGVGYKNCIVSVCGERVGLCASKNTRGKS